ncbi:MAG: diguanylate cyclase [Pseudomonadales bacterium]
MNKNLESKILSCRDLPSPPIVAARIVNQVEEDCQLSDLVNIVSDDQATAMKLMRLANSAAYRGTKPCSTLLAAVTRLGINVSVMTALSFSLANTLRASGNSKLDHDYLWRRSVTSAAAARFLATRAQVQNWEECFLAALVQDIGMLAADCAIKDIYQDLSVYAQHEYAQLAERQSLKVDHSQVGASLLKHWKLPASIVDAVAQSHALERLMKRQTRIDSLWCVAYSGILADAVLLSDELELARAIALCRACMGDLAGSSESEFTHALFASVKDAEELFEATLVPNMSELVVSSKNLMFDYMIGQGHSANDEHVSDLQLRVEELEEENRRDALTGAYNRQYFDEVLDGMINEASQTEKPLSLMFIDADHFKQINDVHGHHVGDEVLKWIASTLQNAVRDTDVVARYGGEEFVAILPTLGEEHAATLGDRIVQGMSEATIKIDELELSVTVSIGIAAACSSSKLRTSRELIVDADQAMYFSKKTGRNKCSRASTLPQQRSV